MPDRNTSVPRPSRWHSLALLVAATVTALPAHPHASARLLAWVDAVFAAPDSAEPAQPMPAEPGPAQPHLVPDPEATVPGPGDAVQPDKMPQPREDHHKVDEVDEIEPRERPSPPAPSVDPGRPASAPQGRYV